MSNIPDTTSVKLFGRLIQFGDLKTQINVILDNIDAGSIIGNILADTNEVFMISAIDCQRKTKVLSTHLMSIPNILTIIDAIQYPDDKEDRNAFTIIIDIPSKFHTYIHLFDRALNLARNFDDIKKKLSIVHMQNSRKYNDVVSLKREYNLAKFVMHNSVAHLSPEAALDQIISVMAGKYSGLIK